MMEWKWCTSWKVVQGDYTAVITTIDNKNFKFSISSISEDGCQEWLMVGDTDSLRKAQRLIFEWLMEHRESNNDN